MWTVPGMSTYRHETPQDEEVARLRLIRTENVGPVTFRDLLRRFGSARDALAALPDLAQRAGRRRPLAIGTAEEAEREIAAVRDLGGHMLHIGLEGYPEPLAAIEDAPPVLTVLGHAHLLHSPCFAVVGGRNASVGGRMLSAAMAREVGAAGYVIVSGLARGIDGAAHEAALETGTVAVVAGGLDVVFPPEHQALYERIAAAGVIVAEQPAGTRPQGRHFPRRNRIISGLSLGVLVIEARRRSGSLITARFAGDHGRIVFAVPGSPQDQRSHGCNDLIRDGAILVQDAADILSELQAMNRHRASEEGPMERDYPLVAADADVERALAALRDGLSHVPVTLDNLVAVLELPPAALLAALIDLELAGHVERQPGGRFARRDPV